MRKIFLLILMLLVPSLSGAVEVPPLRGHVNDYASLLTPQAAEQLETELTGFEQSDSTQIVVLTVPSLEGQVLEEYSIKVVEAWKIGQKGKDNGALLLVAKNEHKIRIEVGRGLEGKLTDLVSGRIIRNEISPAFKRGDFDGGITAGVRAIEASVRGEYQAEPQRDLQHGKRGANPIFTLLIFVLVATVFLGGISKILGGLAGAVGLPVAGMLSFGLGGFALIALAVVGFFAGMIVSLLFSSRGGGFFGGGPFIGGGGFGGGWGGGGGGGGGFFGGGGTFGGGGASGDW